MERKFLQLDRIECSDVMNKSKGDEHHFDLTHLSLKELEELKYGKLNISLLKAAWCNIVKKISFDNLAEVSIPEKWIEELESKAEREVWYQELREALVTAWFDHLITFDSLIIYFNQNNSLTEDAFDTFLEALRNIESAWFEKYQQEPKISLFLANHALGDSAIFSLHSHFTYSTSLVYLDLDNNPISSAGAKALALFLEEQRSLKVLQLVGTQMGDQGLDYLIKGIKRSQSLREVYLGEDDYSSTSLEKLEKLAVKYPYLDIIELCPKRRRPARLIG
jgi:hypothetical protein